PVALAKASSSATNASSSACTKCFHRSIASCAFFSGFHGAVCAHALAHPSSAGPPSAPVAAVAVAPLTSARRARSVMMASSVILTGFHLSPPVLGMRLRGDRKEDSCRVSRRHRRDLRMPRWGGLRFTNGPFFLTFLYCSFIFFHRRRAKLASAPRFW